MKTILRIVIILLVAAIVAEGFSLIVNSTSLISSNAPERGNGQLPTTDNTNGQSMQRPESGEGGEGTSFIRGISDLLITIAKIAGITVAVLFIQKAFDMIYRHNRKLNFAG